MRISTEPSRRRRWLTWSLVAIAVVVALRLLAPSILAPWITARLSAGLGVPAQIDDVALSLWAGEITVLGIEAAPAPEESASTLRVDSVTLRWRWRDLLLGKALVDASVSGLDVVLDLHRPWPAVHDGRASRSHALRSLDVESGAIAVVLDANTPAILVLTDLRARVDVSSPRTRAKHSTTHVTASAQTGEGGSFSLDAAIAPVSRAESWSVRFTVDRLDLRRLNPLFQAAFEMDVEHGFLSLDGWLTVGFGRLRGHVQPRFDELQLLGRGERKVRHPMGEALFSSMLSGADVPIEIDQAAVSTGDSLLEELARIDAIELLEQIIVRGLVRRLDTLDGYESAVGGIEVDFPAGRLSFFDITLTRIGGAVGRPFVAIARMDIVVEQSAVDTEVVTYKSITLHEPSLIFVTGETPAKSQLRFDPDWQEKVSVLPYPTDRLEIFDGRIEYRDDTTVPPTSLFVADVDLQVENLGRARVDGSRRGATLVGRGQVMDLSPLTLDVEFSPGVVPLDAAMLLHLDPVELPQLNELLRGRLGVDVSSGTLAVTADLDVHEGHLHGTVTPELHDVRVLGVDEIEVEHPLKEFLLERRLRKLDGTPLVLDYRLRRSVVRELPAALMSAMRHAR